MHPHYLAACLCAALVSTAPAIAAEPSFVNSITLSADSSDLSGLGSGANLSRLGFFSDLYYQRNQNAWYALSDRGPGGGVLSYETRVQKFTLDVNPLSGAISNFQVQQTIRFNQNGNPFNGLNPQLLSGNPGTLGRSFDPEGFIVSPTGSFYVADEYGPSVYEFSSNGNFVRAFNTPSNLVPQDNTPAVNYVAGRSSTPPLVNGRQDNRGFEGLAMSPDGSTLYAMLQDPLVNEGSSNDGRRSPNLRIVKFDTASGNSSGQYIYQLEPLADINARVPGNTFGATAQGRNIGISAITAIDDHQFLVLERDNRGVGVEDADGTNPAASKRVYLIDTNGASDVSALSLAGSNALPGGVTAVSKTATPYLDLQAALSGAGLFIPEKLEGFGVGPQLTDGTYLLLAGTDNDYSVTQNGSNVQFDVYTDFNSATTELIQRDLDSPNLLNGVDVGPVPAGYSKIPGMLYAFKTGVGDTVMASYTAPVPEPQTYALLALGLGFITWQVRRRR